MNDKESYRFTSPKTAIIALTLLSTVACGAAVPKQEKTAKPTPPVKPVTYDPRVSFSLLVEKVAPAVVNIRATAKTRARPHFLGPGSLFEWFFGPGGPEGGHPFFRRPPEQEREQRALGSGFIIDKKGLVVTNHHVVEKADEIEVQLADDRTFDAKVVGSDERTAFPLGSGPAEIVVPRGRLPGVLIPR